MRVDTKINSVIHFKQIESDIEMIKQAMEKKDFYSLDIFLMEEKDVLNFLKISRSTLFNYREKNEIKAYYFFGRNVYWRHEIYQAIINQLLK